MELFLSFDVMRLYKKRSNLRRTMDNKNPSISFRKKYWDFPLNYIDWTKEERSVIF
ncbi:hypothetical protein J2T13_000624 [Paenibacillus sp. DS2015]